ncbi:homoserine kinase [Parvularcula oceani]|uniref:homoserine kinase n=1 Tax=Parvularcula oceani TaxID=1247963 RepID=UPI0004E21E72|nr:homoserine kinase [Parvularcula oceani]
MAVYTHVPDGALNAFLSSYGLPAATMFKGIAEGVENSNYLVETAGERFILTLYERRVDPGDLPYFLGLMDFVADAGLPAARPLTGRDGERLRTLCGRPAALITFVSGVSPEAPSPAQARAAGAALARLHRAAEPFEGRRANALGPDGWQALFAQIAPRLDEVAPGFRSEVGHHLERALAPLPGLPAGTIHADLFPDNVLFEGDRVTGLIDFYFACTDRLAYDLAIALNAWTKEPEDGEAPDPAGPRAFLAGYESIRPLAGAERDALPQLLTGAALRFLLTRAHDWLHRVPGACVSVKDPLPYLRLLRHHERSPDDFLEA